MSARFGLLSESIFISEALSRNLDISVPIGDHQPYDLVVHNGPKMFRVQVKSTRCTGRAAIVNVSGGKRGGKKRPYLSSDFDVVAIYLATEGVWYLLPFLTGAIRLGGNKYSKFINNWKIFN